jgi:hypothetical protein
MYQIKNEIIRDYLTTPILLQDHAGRIVIHAGRIANPQQPAKPKPYHHILEQKSHNNKVARKEKQIS